MNTKIQDQLGTRSYSGVQVVSVEVKDTEDYIKSEQVYV